MNKKITHEEARYELLQKWHTDEVAKLHMYINQQEKIENELIKGIKSFRGMHEDLDNWINEIEKKELEDD